MLDQWQEMAHTAATQFPNASEQEKEIARPAAVTAELLKRAVVSCGAEPEALARGISDEVRRELVVGATWCLANVHVTRTEGGLEVETVQMH
jgi:hypothetical protein